MLDEGITSFTLDSETSDIEISGTARIIAKHTRESLAMNSTVFPEKKKIAIGWSDGVIEIRNTETFGEIRTLEKPSDYPATSLSPCMLDEKHLVLASYACGKTVMWDTEHGEEVWRITEDRQPLVNGFNCDNSKFAISGSDGKINVYDVEDHKLPQILQGSMDPDIMDGHSMRVFSLRFHPSRPYEVVSGGWDNTVQFWDIRETFSRRKIRGPHICGSGIEFLDDNKFVTASWTKKNPLQMWDYRNGKLIDNILLEEWTCFLYFCRFVEEQSFLFVGGSHKNMLRILDVNTFKTLITFKNLSGAVYFAENLRKQDSPPRATNICFGSNTSVYVAAVEA